MTSIVVMMAGTETLHRVTIYIWMRRFSKLSAQRRTFAVLLQMSFRYLRSCPRCSTDFLQPTKRNNECRRGWDTMNIS